jgi:hypothetical protein
VALAFGPDTVLEKTALGRQEIAARALRLLPRARVLLVMIDGRKSLGEISDALSGASDVVTTAEKLAELGLVADTRPAAAAPRPAAAPASPARFAPASAPPLPAAEKLAVARREAARALYDALGPDGDAFTARIEVATTAATLLQEAQRAAELMRQILGAARAEAFLARLQDRLR